MIIVYFDKHVITG